MAVVFKSKEGAELSLGTASEYGPPQEGLLISLGSSDNKTSAFFTWDEVKKLRNFLDILMPPR